MKRATFLEYCLKEMLSLETLEQNHNRRKLYEAATLKDKVDIVHETQRVRLTARLYQFMKVYEQRCHLYHRLAYVGRVLGSAKNREGPVGIPNDAASTCTDRIDRTAWIEVVEALAWAGA
jgi:hypothetical protein